jgi:hypothetical protein
VANTNLERLWEVRDTLPIGQERDLFVATFIGSLSMNVPAEIWDRSLRIAKEAAEADRG